MAFESPENIWQKKYGHAFKSKEKSESGVMLDVVSLIIHNQDNHDLSRLFDEIGLETFTKVVEVFEGRTIRFPTKDTFRDTLVLALCYYYNQIEGKSWNEIKEILPYEINPVSMGIKISHLNRSIRKKMNDMLYDIKESGDGE